MPLNLGGGNGSVTYSGGRFYNNGVLIDPLEFTKAEFDLLVSSDYSGVIVRVTNVHSTSAGVGGILFAGGSSWELESPQIYYATFSAGISAFPASSWNNLRMCFGDVGAGRVVHVSNGTRYVPDGGRFTFFKGVYGTVASPTLTGGGAGTTFALTLAASAPTIPAGYLAAGDVIQVKGRFQKHGTAAIVPSFVRIGTAGTSADADIWFANVPNTDLNHTQLDCYASVADATHFVTNGSSLQAGTGGAGQLVDKTTNFNIASAMIISVTGTKNTADSIDLLSLIVEIITSP